MERNDKIIKILESGVANVQRNEELINDLNVFPVPDGDTGSNMVSTLLSGLNQVQDNKDDIENIVDIFKFFSQGCLYGARGNSGVITSQIFKGLYEGVKLTSKNINKPSSIKKILKALKENAYNSVPNPVEGTILSITKALHTNYSSKSEDISEIMNEIVIIANEALENTPNQLEILKSSGVVDSGAKGLVLLFEGIASHYEGRTYQINVNAANKEEKFVKADPNKNIGYCSEFILTLKSPEEYNNSEILVRLKQLGDSVVLIREDDLLKIHVHVKNPGDLLSNFHDLGEYSKIKIENMTTQVSENVTINEEINKTLLTSTFKKQKLSIISVGSGKGIVKIMSENGADIVINGGQTMNPSVNDFIDSINKLESEEILILPNNSNIIMSAEKAAELSDKNVYVLPTKSIQSGIAILENINEEFIPISEFKEVLMDLLSDVKTGEVTTASKDTILNEIEIKKGEFISISDKKIISSEIDVFDAVTKLIDYILEDDKEIIRIYYGNSTNDKIVRKIRRYISKNYSEVDSKIAKGNQEVYQFLLFSE